MLPGRTSQPPLRCVRSFELLTPAGMVYRYPRPTLLRHVIGWLHAHADTAVVSTLVLALIYSAGALAEVLPSMQFKCRD